MNTLIMLPNMQNYKLKVGIDKMKSSFFYIPKYKRVLLCCIF